MENSPQPQPLNGGNTPSDFVGLYEFRFDHLCFRTVECFLDLNGRNFLIALLGQELKMVKVKQDGVHSLPQRTEQLVGSGQLFLVFGFLNQSRQFYLFLKEIKRSE
jgi:hypothetical protein